MRRIDLAAIHTIGIPRLLLMEHAGLAVARAARDILPQTSKDILVCCGSGYNGGDGLCAARHLTSWGYRAHVMLLDSVGQLKEEPAIYARIIQALGVPIVEVRSVDELNAAQVLFLQASVVIDALLGIGLEGPVRPLYAALIKSINSSSKPVVAVDVPSGLDGDTGRPHGIAVKATITVTLGLPKQGFFLAEGPKHLGELIVDDIGLPASLLKAP